MVKLIQDLWILSQGGNVLYKRVFNVKKVKEGLNKISKIFFTKYKDILTDWDNWDRNTDSFSDFEGIIKAYLKVQ